MGALRRAAAGLSALFRSSRVDRELDEELRAYVDASVDAKMRAGLGREEARRASRLELGSLDAVKDSTRDAGWEATVEDALRDLRYGARRLTRSPTFTAAAVVTLALGIGVNTAIFSVINAVMLRQLDVDDPAALVALQTAYPQEVESVFSYAGYRRFADEPSRLVDPAAFSSARRTAVALDGLPETVDVKWVSGNYFTMLGVRAAAGRTLLPADDRPDGGEAVAVLSDAWWTRRFGRDPGIVGRSFSLRGRAFTIVGVAPRGFAGETLGEHPDLWLPLSAQPATPSWVWNGHSTTWLGILARRRPQVSLEQARVGLEAVYARLREEIAAETESQAFREQVLASRLLVSHAPNGASRLRDNLSTPLMLVMGIVALVLLVACVNVATLTLARAAARQRETAVSLALGASRSRIVRQGVAEALLLGVAGGLAGLGLAVVVGPLLVTLVASALPIGLDVTPDLRVLAFATVLSCATPIAFGVVPAFRAAGVDPLTTLRAGSPAGRGASRMPLGRTLVVGQIAVTLMLLVAAGLFARSLLKLNDVEMGFDPEQVLLFRMTSSGGGLPPGADARRELYRRLLAQAESVAGVAGASASFSGVFTRETWRNAVAIDGFVPPDGVTPRTLVTSVTPRFFDVMRIAVVEGRGFTDADQERSTPVAVVNEAFARRYSSGRDAVGLRVALCSSDPCGPSAQAMEVVGVVENAKYADVREEPRPMLYVPFTQHDAGLQEIQVRTSGDPASVAAATFRALARADARVAVVSVTDAEAQVAGSLALDHLTARLSAACSLLALVLASIGLYGVVAFATARRTTEIGVRMALGAGAREVRRLVLRDTVALVATGLAVGVPLALAGAHVLASQLFSTGPADFVALSTAVATLTLVAVIAGYLPARRATRLDPIAVLRAE